MFFGFDCDFYFSTGLQLYGLAILVLQSVFDTNFFVETFRPFYRNLRFIGAGTTPGMIFSTFPGSVTEGFSGVASGFRGPSLMTPSFLNTAKLYPRFGRFVQDGSATV
jgi:hypothetical protein